MSRFAYDVSVPYRRTLVDARGLVREAVGRRDQSLLEEIRRTARGSDRRYRCIDCDVGLTVKLPTTVDSSAGAHFAHPPVAPGAVPCDGEGGGGEETIRHREGIAILGQWLLHQDAGCAPQVNQRLPGSSDRRRPDILAWPANHPVAIEFQVSRLNPDTAVDRVRAFREYAQREDALSLWVFDRGNQGNSGQFKYAFGNRVSSTAGKRVDLTPEQNALLQAGAHICWLERPRDEDQTDFIALPYFGPLDPTLTDSRSGNEFVRRGGRILVPQPLSTDPRSCWVWAVERLPLSWMVIDTTHSTINCQVLLTYIRQHQQQIDAALLKPDSVVPDPQPLDQAAAAEDSAPPPALPPPPNEQIPTQETKDSSAANASTDASAIASIQPTHPSSAPSLAHQRRRARYTVLIILCAMAIISIMIMWWIQSN